MVMFKKVTKIIAVAAISMFSFSAMHEEGNEFAGQYGTGRGGLPTT
jgi:hypothetical protein